PWSLTLASTALPAFAFTPTANQATPAFRSASPGEERPVVTADQSVPSAKVACCIRCSLVARMVVTFGFTSEPSGKVPCFCSASGGTPKTWLGTTVLVKLKVVPGPSGAARAAVDRKAETERELFSTCVVLA